MKKFVSIFILLFGASAFSQILKPSDFVIDSSKPFVYLKFDHIGPRKPIQTGESNTGIWIKVVNNCRLPIVFLGFDASESEPGVGLMDEVVEDEQVMLITGSDQEVKKYKRDWKLRKEKLKHMPKGYVSETAGIITLQSGKEILFSVPVEHISDYWHMQVRFALNLKNWSIVDGPFTYLPFYKWDIPMSERPDNSPTTQSINK